VLFVLLSMFGGEGTKKNLSGIVKGSSKWFDHFNIGFSRDKTPFVGLILLVSMGDVSLIQMLPWNKSVFHTESKGFPCLSLLEFCLGLDTWQASASVICQIIYLGMSGTINDATTSPQAKALFGLNISISIIGVVMGLLMLYLKDNLMKTVEQRKSVVLGATDGVSDCEGDDDYVELGEVTSFTDNPLHTQERAIESGEVIDRGDASAGSNSVDLQTGNTTVLQHEHERAVEENEKLKAENSELRRKQSELEDKRQGELDKKQRDLDENKRANDREMQAVKAEKCQIEERASRAEAKLVEVEAKLERRTETGTL
jgi:regulator of replication initiation timing